MHKQQTRKKNAKSEMGVMAHNNIAQHYIRYQEP